MSLFGGAVFYLLTIATPSSDFLQNLLEKKEAPCATCISGPSAQEQPQGKNLMVFMSFSVPLGSWKDLSDQLEKTEGIFIVRGIPDDSFERLAEKIVELRAAEVFASIEIDPESFEKYGIQSVPAFVLKEGEHSDQISGNLRLDAALREIAEKGDVSRRAKEILQSIEGQA
jgi:type-F conjugative transfer system pilin assembly protein TrbC